MELGALADVVSHVTILQLEAAASLMFPPLIVWKIKAGEQGTDGDRASAVHE